MTRDGVTYYYVFNAHGDTVALVDSTGTVRATYSYDPWGQVTVTSGSTIKNPFLYAGQFGIYHDVATGLDLMQSRYYNSGIQRFMSMDEFPGIVAKPISHNAYIYVHNDPINNVDPDGHWPQWISNAWNAVKETASTVWNAVESAASWVWNQIEYAASWVSEKVQSAYRYVTSSTRKAARKISQRAKSTAKALAQKAADAKRMAAEKAAEAKRIAEEKAKQLREEAKSKFEEMASDAEDQAQRALEAFKSSKIGNFSMGMGDAVVGAVTGIYNMVRHPIDSVQAIGNAIAHPIQTGKAIWNGISQSYQDNVVNGDANSTARFWGRALGEVGLALVGTKGLDKAAKLGKAGKLGEAVAFTKELGLNYIDELSNPVLGIAYKGNLQRALERTVSSRRGVAEGAGEVIPKGKTFVDLMEPAEAARYERYWKQNYKSVFEGQPNTRQRTYTTPRNRSIIDQKINEKTGELYSRETIYDKFGRRIGNNDFTDHARPDVPSHTNPHHHPNPWYNPDQHGPATPGLHPETPKGGR